MESACKYVLVLAGVSICTGMMPARTEAQTPPPTCLAPMQAGEADPAPRDVSYTVSADKKSVTAIVCVVSNRDRISLMEVSFGVFDSTGKLVGLDGQNLGALNPINDPTPNHPKIVSLSATGIALTTALTAAPLSTALIQFEWAPCTNPMPDQCNPGPTQTDTFLRDVTAGGAAVVLSK